MTASRQITVENELGLHARPAMQFVDLANQFQSQIKVSKVEDEEKVEADGKSVMQMLTLAAIKGTVLQMDVDGPDANEAIEKLAKLFEEKFGEE